MDENIIVSVMGFGCGSGRYPASDPLNHEPVHPHWESLFLVKLVP